MARDTGTILVYDKYLVNYVFLINTHYFTHYVYLVEDKKKKKTDV